MAGSIASAQQTITYTNGQISGTFIPITSANNPTTLTISSGSATQSGVISDSGTIGVIYTSGMGEVELTGTNTYTGGTTVSSGTLIIGNNSALGTGAVTINNGASFGYDAPAGNRPVSNNFSLGGTIGVTGSNGWMTLGGTTSLTSNTTLYANGTLLIFTDIQQVNAGTTLSLNGSGGSYNILGTDRISQTTVGANMELILVKASADNSTILNSLTIQNGGTVGDGADNQLGSSATLTINTGGEFDVSVDTIN